MEHLNVLRPMLELAMMIPAAILCFLPMKGHLRGREKTIAVRGIPAMLLWAALGGTVCYLMVWKCYGWLLASVACLAFLLLRLVEMPPWKSISVLLGVCGVYSSITNLAVAADAAFSPDNTAPWLSFEGSAVCALLSWVLLAALWYPATHIARLLLSEMEMPVTWYVFWIFPVVSILVNIFIRPIDYQTLYVGRLMRIYVSVTLILLGLIVLFYLMFALMARGLGANMRLRQENHFLQLQAAQYRTLQKNIEETRRARHDLRQHLKVIQGCIDSGDMRALTDYVKQYSDSIPPETVRTFCKSYAADVVLRYYAEKAREGGIDIEIDFQTGEKTIIPEPEFCVLLGNLLENALEACIGLEGRPLIRACARQTGESMLILTVDNTSPGLPVWEDGQLRSSKREGFGTGTESVRMIAKRYDGDARFEWKDGTFCASVLLNP